MLSRLRYFWVRVFAMMSKETLHIRRDPRTLYMAFIMPVVMLFLFGYGVSFDLDSLPILVADGDQSEASRALVQAFEQSREFVPVARTSADDVEPYFRRGEALAALVIPKGYGEHIAKKETAPVELLIDGSDVVVAQQVRSKADATARAHTQKRLGASANLGAPPLSVKVFTRYNPQGKSAFFMVPGLSVYLLAISAVLLTALTVAGEWERGSMEQLFASPIGRFEIVLGKLLPYLGLGLVALLLVLAFGSLAFDVPMRGSLVLVFAMGFFFLVGMLGQGLLISVVTKNQLVATQAGAVSGLLPSLILSGMMFPVENMPRILQGLSYIVPARYFVRSMREILLKGNGLATVWPDFLAQVVFAVVIVAIITLKFQRRLA